MVWRSVRKLLLDLVHSHERSRENGERERECRWRVRTPVEQRSRTTSAPCSLFPGLPRARTI